MMHGQNHIKYAEFCSDYKAAGNPVKKIASVRSVVCLTTSPCLVPRQVFREAQSHASVNYQYPLFSLRSSSGCLRFLRFPVTSILHNMFQKLVPMQRVANPVTFPASSFFLLYVGYSFSS